MVVDINWNNFKAKFKNQEQAAFEQFCYLLFCGEYGKDTGIFRFKNHAGIETNPIEMNGQVIGWQAKFYDTPLSKHTDEFIKSIDVTKTRHPTVNKIIFYTNQDFGQDQKKTDPQYKTEIETHAKTKDIDIEWRTASYFESPAVCEQDSSVAEHFFSLKKGILDSLAELALHTESVLNPIRSEICYYGTKIKLDRSEIITGVKQAGIESPVILSGAAGVGKTAAIKDFYESVKNSSPFFVFKATEFKNISHINQLFKAYGELTAADFITEHKDITDKYAAFDSAEKLSEIEDQDVFRLFLSSLLENRWRVLFTVRYTYLDDLRFQLKEVYRTTFTSLIIPTLTRNELEKAAADYGFNLPHNERLVSLLAIPLYLNEYLQNYATLGKDIGYGDFRDMIWKKQIQDSTHQLHNLHIRREECFLMIARQRANDGGFFVKTSDFDQEALHKLAADEIIKYDSNAGGYFITHDVYEEWALDKMIERAFLNAGNYNGFYEEIGHALPIRRAFRNWLSDKLLMDDGNVQALIDFTVTHDNIDRHWKDEVLVSVLLSDYSSIFFNHFEDKLLEDPGTPNDDTLLHRMLFLLRIACKTADENLLRLLGLEKTSDVSLKTILTVPKGSGWGSTITFINGHKDQLRFRYMAAILPVLDEWTRSCREGETTKNAAQLALFYYEELTNQDDFYFGPRDDVRDKIVSTILNGSGEIKTELARIIEEIISHKDISHTGRYYELAKAILSSIVESSEITKHLSKEILKLADLFWFQPLQDTDRFDHYSGEIERYFGLSEGDLRYYPASAFQTPIFQLLQTDPQSTSEFILSFTNKSIEYFAKTEFARHEVEQIDVVVDDSGTTVKQYICHRIWNIYRGTQVAPDLLESIHMALEKWLLAVAKTAAPEIVESWCSYFIQTARSASITAIVTSVVLAEPSKLFNVAKVLFKTKDLFFFDASRMRLDTSAKSYYSISHDPTGIFTNERLQTCNDKHRSHSLEQLALQYQMFFTEGEGEEVAHKRQAILWKIFDDYYGRLPQPDQEVKSDKHWRLCLARMDRRKMNIATETQNDQVLISFTPEIDPELKQYSETSLAKTSESMRYLPLQLWARYRLERNEDHKKYPQYDNDPGTALAETKQVIDGLRNDSSDDKTFTLYYHSLPPHVCAVLIRDYVDKLTAEERAVCKDTLIAYASAPLRDDYRYQVSDGVGAAIGALPALETLFPQDANEIKKLLLFTLFDAYPIGMNQHLLDYPVAAIVNALWKDRFADANSIFIGYLALKPKYDELGESARQESHRSGVYEMSKRRLLDIFIKANEVTLDKIAHNEIAYSDIVPLDQIDPDTLVTAFRLLPSDTANDVHKQFVRTLLPIFSKKLFTDTRRRDRDNSFEYSAKHKFLEKLAYVLLSSEGDDMEVYVEPFLEDFKASKSAAELFSELITVEDKLTRYERFWAIWKLFYPKIVALVGDSKGRNYFNDVIRTYLLAWSYWRDGAREWHSLRDRERQFFRKASEEIGGHPAVFYSIAKLLSDIGSGFRDEGVLWISDMVKNNPNLVTAELEVNTIYYVENLVRWYILSNRQKIKTTRHLKSQIIVILDFLLLKGSVTGYLLREDIL